MKKMNETVNSLKMGNSPYFFPSSSLWWTYFLTKLSAQLHIRYYRAILSNDYRYQYRGRQKKYKPRFFKANKKTLTSTSSFIRTDTSFIDSIAISTISIRRIICWIWFSRSQKWRWTYSILNMLWRSVTFIISGTIW